MDRYEYEYRIFLWIISVDISVLLKIYGYEYEYAKFSRIPNIKWKQLSSVNIIHPTQCALGTTSDDSISADWAFGRL
jgi:hypothetical protein